MESLVVVEWWNAGSGGIGLWFGKEDPFGLGDGDFLMMLHYHSRGF